MENLCSGHCLEEDLATRIHLHMEKILETIMEKI